MSILNRADFILKRASRKIEVERAKMQTEKALTGIELSKLQNTEELEPEVDRIDTLKANIESKRKLQAKAWTFRLSANALNIISALMTISGIAGTTSLLNIGGAFTGRTGVFAITTALLQLCVMNINSKSWSLKQNHFLNYKKVGIFKFLVISISMVGNYKYMNSIMPSRFYNMISLAVAFSLDCGAVYISDMSTAIKYRLYSNDTSACGNLTRLDKFLAIASQKIFGWIDRVYDETFNYKSPAKPVLNNKPIMVCSAGENQKPKSMVTSSNHAWLQENDFDENEDAAEQKTPTKVDINVSKVMEQISTLPKGTVVTKDTFGLSQYDWKNVRERLDQNNVVECKAKKTYIL